MPPRTRRAQYQATARGRHWSDTDLTRSGATPRIRIRNPVRDGLAPEPNTLPAPALALGLATCRPGLARDMDAISDDLLQHVLGGLGALDLARCGQCCARLRRIAGGRAGEVLVEDGLLVRHKMAVTSARSKRRP